MTLTCVTAVFNAIKLGNRERLVRCVESVAALKTKHEHLIYDGASTDGTVELLRELEVKTPGLKVVSEPDTGIYNALNKGVRDAVSEWFYVLGCDDYIESPDLMAELIESGYEDVQEIFAPVHSVRNGELATPFLSELYDSRFLFNFAVFPHQGRISRTAMIRRYGGFDERYRIAADTNQALLIHLGGETCHFTPKPFAMFSDGGASVQMASYGILEDRQCVERALQMTPRQVAFFEKTNVLPLELSLKYCCHTDYAVSRAARSMIWRWFRRYLRIVLYPAVLLKHFLFDRANAK